MEYIFGVHTWRLGSRKVTFVLPESIASQEAFRRRSTLRPSTSLEAHIIAPGKLPENGCIIQCQPLTSYHRLYLASDNSSAPTCITPISHSYLVISVTLGFGQSESDEYTPALSHSAVDRILVSNHHVVHKSVG
ncbi:16604_t:CDS:2 [Acaulospora colombiana]|uniref:16604_t:CDS:1 n=1 Tax=Acaulospora colombiana TaxID=27376 RepID=A0ACA9NCG6_9GLOM|nr:16604_t:CDS:2 [Acaulospora colombiana]